MSRTAFLKWLIGLVMAAALASPAAAETLFQGSRISVVTTGKGPDVVLIPGLTASRNVWRGTVAALPGYRYHLVQLAGFAGEPARGNAQGKVAASAAEEIARYIAAKGLQRPAVVGHSMGGTIAMMIAARHPAAVGRLMVVDMVPAPARLFGVPSSTAGPVADLLREQFSRTAPLRQRLGWVVARFGRPEWVEGRDDSDVVARSLQELVATDLTPELARLRIPFTVVYACPDPVPVTRGAVDRLYAGAYAGVRGVRLVRIERSGHTIMADQPGPFRAALKAFLGRG